LKIGIWLFLSNYYSPWFLKPFFQKIPHQRRGHIATLPTFLHHHCY